MDSSAEINAKKIESPNPYKSSWANRFSNWVEGLPGSGLVYYVGLWLSLTLLQIIALSTKGADPIALFQVPQTFLAGAIAFMAGMFQYFNQRASKALATIKPVLTLNDEAYQAMEFRLTRLPVGRPLIAALVSIALLLLNESIVGTYWPEELQPYAFSSIIFRGTYYICWAVFGVFVYQSLHRLKWINQVYSQHTRINLFNKSPLYGLSNLAALTAGSITVLPLGFLISSNLLDISLLDPATIITVSLIQVVAFLSFIWPQLGIQRLQRVEKDRLISEAHQRYQKVFQELYRRIDQGEYESPPNFSATITSLEKEIARIESIPLWPWEPETVRWLLTALVLPVGFMILQLILQRALE